MLQPLIRVKGNKKHGLLSVLPNSVKKLPSGLTPKQKETILKEKEHNARIVKARYNHRKNPLHGELQIPYTLGAGEQIQMWHFLSGEEYEIPVGLVEHVNSAKGRINRSKDDSNSSASKEEGTTKEHEFIPTGF